MHSARHVVQCVTHSSFAHWMLLKARAEGDTRRCAVVATVVSSAAVGRMAEVEGFEFHQTATGFKNIGAMGLQLKQQVCSDPTVPSESALTLLLQLP